MRATPVCLFSCFLLAASLCAVSAQSPKVSRDTKYTPQELGADFDFFWQSVNDNYAYLDAKATDWNKARDVYRAQLAGVQTRAQFTTLLEHAVEELYDPHVSLGTNLPSSPRLVPTGADVWAEWQGSRAVVSEVRPGGSAEKTGLRAGMEILSINGLAVRQAVRQRLGRCLRRPDPAADDWALRALLAGRHDEARRFVARDGDRPPVSITPDDAAAERGSGPDEDRPLLSAALLRQDPRIGCIRLNNSLGQTKTIAQFDAALDKLKDTRGLVLDLRDTPSGGNTTVARGILGRFIAQDMFYQRHDSPAEARTQGIQQKWVDIVSPRGPRYSGPVVVLVDHWTGSMGEGMAVGMDAMKRGTVVGTRMAGLNGATEGITLPSTGIGVSFPTERLFHVNGTPREVFIPPVLVDLARRDGRGSDAILDAGLKVLLEKMRTSARMN